MREFFKKELEQLHLKTGFQQYFKLSDEEFTNLLDLLVAECDKFPMIPDVDKKKIIQTCMIEDADFQGFNPKILWKWFNAACRKFIVSQSQYQEEDPASFVPCPPEERERLIKEWREALSKVGNPQVARPDGIKDHRIQKMRDGFRGIECKHPTLIDVSDTEDVCNACGKSFPKATETNTK